MADLIKLKNEIALAKEQLKAAQTWLENLADSVKAVFKEHKTEMLVAAGAGFAVGALLF